MDRIKFTVIAAIIAFTVLSCGSDEDTQPEILSEPQIEETQTEQAVKEPGIDQYTYKKSDALGNLPKITSISISTRSANTRDGFEAHAQMDRGDTSEVDLIYEWKLNGNPIRGETGSVLEWQPDFSKGDNLAVLVIPISEYGQGVWQAEGSIVIPNTPPEITSKPGDLFKSGQFSYQVQAVDPDGDEIDYTLRGAPEGMIIEPATGTISWEYGTEDQGEYEVMIVVTDSDGAQATQILTFSIYDQNNPTDTAP